MSRGLVILGAGGLGREVAAYARDAGLDVDGFLDDNPQALARFGTLPLVLGPMTDFTVDAEHAYVVGVGDPLLRRALGRRLAELGARVATIVHPTAYVGARTRLGEGVVVGPFGFVSVDCEVGGHTVLNTYASVGHDCVVAANVVLSPYATLNGAVTVGEGAFFGSHCDITPGRSVGRWAKVGAGAVVTRDVEPGALVMGNPAKGRVMFDPDPAG